MYAFRLVTFLLIACSLVSAAAAQGDPPPTPKNYIEPGSGWSGAWTPNTVTGACEEAVPVSHWDRIPHQVLFRESQRDFTLGIIAYDVDGIDHIDVAVENGTIVTLDEMYKNPDTGHYAYFVTLDNDDFPNTQSYEVRARVVPVGSGTERILSFDFYQGEDLDAGSDYFEYWVDPVSGNDNNSGTSSSPLRTFNEAINKMNSSGTEGSQGIVHLEDGTTPVTQDLEVLENDWPLVVRPAAGATSVVFYPRKHSTIGESLFNIKHLRLEGLDIDISNEFGDHASSLSNRKYSFDMDSQVSFFGEASLYFSDCTLEGLTIDWANGDSGAFAGYALLGIANPAAYRESSTRKAARVFVEDSIVTEIYGNEPMRETGWVRNVDLSTFSNGAFHNCEAVIDSQVSDNRQPILYTGETLADAYGYFIDGDFTADNALCDALEVTDSWCGGGFGIQGTQTGSAPDSDFAVVNSLFLPSPSLSFPDNFVGEPNGALVSRHVLIQHVSVAGSKEIVFRNTAGGAEQFPCSLVQATIAERFVNVVGTCPDGSWEGLDFENEYIHITSTVGADNLCTASWTAGTAANTFLASFKIKSTSPAHGAIPSSAQSHKYSLKAHLRGATTAVGARKGESE